MPVRQSIVVDLLDMDPCETEAEPSLRPSPTLISEADHCAEVSPSSPPVGQDSELSADGSASTLDPGDEEYNAENDAAEESEVHLDQLPQVRAAHILA